VRAVLQKTGFKIWIQSIQYKLEAY